MSSIRDEVIDLGIKAQHAREYFHALGTANCETDPEARERQTRLYETARADMHAAEAKHQAAIEKLRRSAASEI